MSDQKTALIRRMSNWVLRDYFAQAEESDRRFDEHMERIDQNMVKGDKSVRAIEEWIKRQSQPQA